MCVFFGQMQGCTLLSLLLLVVVVVEVVVVYRAIGLMSRVFANGSWDRCSISGRVMPKTQKMALDATLLSTLHYKVRIKGKVEQWMEWSSTLLYTYVQ